MRLLYEIIIRIYQLVIKAASLFNAKARLWVNGRDGLLERLATTIPPGEKIIWFHCASLGEFEQGRPVMEKIKSIHPEYKLLLTFFSPSGYEVRKNYAGADYIFYLPADTMRNAKKFISIIQPVMVFFIKYEFWFNYLQELKKNGIPVYLVSGIFRNGQHFFKWYGTWQRKQLTAFHHFFVQDEESLSLLKTVGYKNVTVSGDTRFDRVYAIAQAAKSIPLVEAFKQHQPLIVAGSTWKEDEELLVSALQQLLPRYPKLKIIIAPHEITEHKIAQLETLIGAGSQPPVYTRYSKATLETVTAARILIIDNMGLLSSLYRYGDIAYVGGGFGKSVHNTLEPATFGIPVLFGPNHKKFKEAIDLIDLGGAFSVTNAQQLEELLNEFINNALTREKSASAAKKYVQQHIGATDKITQLVLKAFPFS